ncbi:MAG: hypothetical protein R3217_08240 [Gammaproteobacteria bacterium]|nr:hypothetical protein [Gammaproteobacteria bacterium]
MISINRTCLLACLTSGLLTLTACGGGGGSSGSDNDTMTDTTSVTVPDPTLTSIQENVFTPICTQCHVGASAPEGLRLEDGMTYGMTVNVASSQVPSLDRIEPGDPDNSYLIQKIEGTAASGERMPRGGPFLSDDVVNAMRQWVTDGAQNNKFQPSDKPATFMAAWPPAASELSASPQAMILLSEAELDATTVDAFSVQLFRMNSDAGQLEAVSGVEVQLTSLQPTVLKLQTAEPLSDGDYLIRLAGQGDYALKDRRGYLIDGDGDGQAGGDYTTLFSIRSE